MASTYDLIVVGTGPASAFFLHGYLERAPKTARVLVLERGEHVTHADRLADHEKLAEDSQQHLERAGGKPWQFGIAVGGTSHLWWACTPRFLPEDFKLKRTYGIGKDWPLSYEDLEPHYTRAEQIMSVSGDSDDTPFERSAPYPLPPHAFTEPEKLLKAAHPNKFFHQPCARPTQAVGQRPACCNSGVCKLCPVDSKFTVVNAMAHLFDDERVTLETGATVESVETSGGVATGVEYRSNGKPKTVNAELVALGAGALFNPLILGRSGLKHPSLGRGLHEQASVRVDVHLGVDNFQGTTSITGHGYMLYSGPRRRRRAAALVETWNVPLLRIQPGKWRRILRMQIIYEDLPQKRNIVQPSPTDPMRAQTLHHGHSQHTQRGLDALTDDLKIILADLPVERILLPKRPRPSEGHIIGTTPMGRSKARSIVDRDLIHHEIRNLLVLGSGTFPVGTPSNPTLTIAALSLRAAERLDGRISPAPPPEPESPTADGGQP